MEIEQKNVLIIDIELDGGGHMAIPINAYPSTTPDGLDKLLDHAIDLYWHWVRTEYYPEVERLIMGREPDGGDAWSAIRALHDEKLSVKINGIEHKGLILHLTEDIPGFGYRFDSSHFKKTVYSILTLQEWIDAWAW